MLKIGPRPAGTSGLKSLPNYAEAELVADAEVDVDVKVGVELSVVKVEVTPLAEDEVADVGSEVVVEVKFDMVELMLELKISSK